MVDIIFKQKLTFLSQDEIVYEIHSFRDGKPVFSNIVRWNRNNELENYHPISGFGYQILNESHGDEPVLRPDSLYDNFDLTLKLNPNGYLKLWVIKSILKTNNDPFHQDLINDLNLMNNYSN